MGSIPGDLRNLIAEQVRDWNVPEIAVGCSGNFTVERVIRAAGLDVPLMGNDVTIYSCTIGRWLAGDTPRLAVRPEQEERWGWLSPYLEDPVSAVATVMLGTRMFEGLNSTALYYERQRAAYRRDWDRLHGQTMDKLRKVDLSLAHYEAGDVVDWFDTLDTSTAVVCFPPFYSNDYANMFKALETVFDWDEPVYEEFGGDRYEQLVAKMQTHDHWIMANNVRRPALEPWLRGIVQTTNRGMPVYVYSNGEQSRVVVPRQALQPIMAPHLAHGMELGDRMTLATLTDGQFSMVRSMYMNHNIRPGTPTLAVAVLVDGVFVGSFAFSMPNGAIHMPGITTPHVYMLSDFPVSGSDYPRLSKLIVMAAVSREAQLLAQKMMSRRVRSLVTTAFSKNPVSMKYRGVYRLLTRAEIPESKRQLGHERYQLNYGSEMGRWTLNEALQEWKQKHGKREDRS